jgi:tetratricopeptide (TPR) repeat protein
MQINKQLHSLVGNRLAASIFLFLVSFVIFIPSLKNDFVWDDIPYILSRIDFLKISNQLPTVVPKKVKEHKKQDYYRPTLHLSLALDNEIWDGKSHGFHLTNIIMHSFTTVFLFLLILLILKEFNYSLRGEVAFISSLLFALHPIHVESVSFIMARSDLLCAMFLSCFFIFYIKSYEKIIYFVLSLLFFFLALISKEVAFVFPVLIIIYDLLRPKYPISKYITRYSICILLFVLYLYLRNKAFVIIPEFSQSVLGGSSGGFDRLIVIVKSFLNAYGFYVYKLFFPFSFNVSPGRLPINVNYIIIAFSLIFSLILFLYRKDRFYSLAAALITLSLMPAVFVSVLDVVTSPYAERFLYIPSAGFCMILGYLLANSKDRFKLPGYSTWILLVLICFIYAFFTVKEQFVWKNNFTLWKKAVQRSPKESMPHLNYGFSLMQQGDIDAAIAQFTKAVEYEKAHNKTLKALAYNNLGYAYLNKGDFEKAQANFKNAYKSDSKYKSTYQYHMGLIYYLKGNKVFLQDKSQSTKYYETALSYLKKSDKKAKIHRRLDLLLAEVSLRLGDYKSARKYAKTSLQPGKANLDEKLRERAKYIIDISSQYQ